MHDNVPMRRSQMTDKYERIERFLGVCTELVEGKYFSADTEISEALAAIAASRELTQLFSAVTQGFDFSAAKRAYLRFPAHAGASHGAAYLPSERSEILAFVFCLFVEFDAGSLQLNDFLLKYFYVDGSYTASYAVFSDRVIRPFRDIVRDCFPDLGKRGQLAELRKAQDALFGELSERLPVEKARLDRYDLRPEEKESGAALLSSAAAAVGRRDRVETKALLTGYRYFLRYIGGEDPSSGEIFAIAEKL